MSNDTHSVDSSSSGIASPTRSAGVEAECSWLLIASLSKATTPPPRCPRRRAAAGHMPAEGGLKKRRPRRSGIPAQRLALEASSIRAVQWCFRTPPLDGLGRPSALPTRRCGALARWPHWTDGHTLLIWSGVLPLDEGALSLADGSRTRISRCTLVSGARKIRTCCCPFGETGGHCLRVCPGLRRNPTPRIARTATAGRAARVSPLPADLALHGLHSFRGSVVTLFASEPR